MAKSTKRAVRDGSKSKAVREYLQKNPTVKNSDVVRALEAEGVAVSYNLVANTRSKMGKSGITTHGKQSKGGGSGAQGRWGGSSAENGHTTSNGVNSSLDAAIHFVRVAGGLDNAKQVLEQLSIIKSL